MTYNKGSYNSALPTNQPEITNIFSRPKSYEPNRQFLLSYKTNLFWTHYFFQLTSNDQLKVHKNDRTKYQIVIMSVFSKSFTQILQNLQRTTSSPRIMLCRINTLYYSSQVIFSCPYGVKVCSTAAIYRPMGFPKNQVDSQEALEPDGPESSKLIYTEQVSQLSNYYFKKQLIEVNLSCKV